MQRPGPAREGRRWFGAGTWGLAAALWAAGATAQEPPLRDAWGDPLPAGAVVRLGTVHEGEAGAARGHRAGVYAVAFAPDARSIASGGGEGEVRLWDARTGESLRALEGAQGTVSRLEFSPNGKWLAGWGTRDAVIHVWEAGSGALVRTLPGADPLFRFAAESDALAVVSEGKAVVYGLPGGETRSTREAPASPIVLSPDAACVLARPRDSDQDSRILYRDLSTGKERQVLAEGTSQARRAAISPDGRIAAVRRSDEQEQKRIRVWELTTGKLLFTLQGHEQMVHAIAFSPDGWFLASGGGDKTVRVWESITGAPLRVSAGHTGHVSAVAFSPDGRRLATASTDRTVLIWDVSPAAFASRLPKQLTPADLERLWLELADADPRIGRRAVGVLASLPKLSGPFLSEQLAKTLRPAQAADILRWIERLDDDSFEAREDASRNLLRLRDVAEPQLKKAYEFASAEARHRLRRILLAKSAPPRFSQAEVLRMQRVVQVLEHAPHDGGRPLLERIVNEFPSGDVIREARQALERIERFALKPTP